MLLNLHVKNYAIIKDINIDFYEGLNILSGETGAGKSLLLKTLNLLKGDRFNKDFIGIFDDRTYVEAVFSSNEFINNILEENGIDTFDNIILSRTFTQNSSITKINNRACNVKLLSEISDLLFDIHGQHSQLIILDKSNYINLIDKFDIQTEELKSSIRKNLSNIELLNKENEKLNMSDEEIEREKDLLKFQIDEIEDFDFDNYDEDNLNKEYKKLTSQSSLIQGTDNIINFLTRSNRQDSFKDMSDILYNELNSLSNIDEDLKEITSDALNIKELISDLSNKIENYSYTLDIDEERIQIIEDIFDKFQVLKLKYGRDSEEILNFLMNSKDRFNTINNIHEKRASIKNDINKLNIENQKLADRLTNIRKSIIIKLEEKIIEELNEMNMQYIDFEIQLLKKDKINKNGQDDIDFLISTNKGQELKSLSTVSSGGEISRFMLAMKAALTEKEEIGTIIFDEIDTGISGKTADIVGDKLKKISKKTQLIVISHLAQIASKADYNYLIYKENKDNQTISNINLLNYDGKVNEIARLISGSDITHKSIESAKELIKE